MPKDWAQVEQNANVRRRLTCHHGSVLVTELQYIIDAEAATCRSIAQLADLVQGDDPSMEEVPLCTPEGTAALRDARQMIQVGFVVICHPMAHRTAPHLCKSHLRSQTNRPCSDTSMSCMHIWTNWPPVDRRWWLCLKRIVNCIGC